MTFTEILRETKEDDLPLYYERATGEVGDILYFHAKARGFKEPDENKRIPRGDKLGIVALPTYRELDHKDLWSYYVKEMVEDKEIRKQLFYALRNHDYYDKFRNLIKEYNLEDEFINFVDDLYYDKFIKWVLNNNIEQYMDKALKYKEYLENLMNNPQHE